MKFCSNCGAQMVDEAVICVSCGTPATPTKAAGNVTRNSGTVTAIKVFMILSTIFYGLYIIPLAWCIPMTVVYFKKVKNNQPIGTGFKVCTLLFVNLIAGILMLTDKD